MRISEGDYNDSVFINCPFDAAYQPLLHVIIYTVYRCGFYPRSALAEDNGLQARLSKIEQLIENCRYGIHDISRIELSSHGLPRFNMPFELGIFFGARRFGDAAQKIKNVLVFEGQKYSYQRSISDLSGIDTKAHNGEPAQVIRYIRDWLSTASRRKTIPGHLLIQKEFELLRDKLPQITASLGFEEDAIPFNDYCFIVEDAIRAIAA